MRKFLTRMAAVVAVSAISAFSVQTASAGGDVGEGPMTHPTIWKGFYLGGHIGIASAESDVSFFGIDFFGFDDDAFAGGVHVGYNWQRGNIVYGIEADYTFTGLEYEIGYSDYDDLKYKGGGELASIDALGSVRGRLGYAVNELLLYATAGIAWKDTDTVLPVDLDDTGYVVGAGAELKLGHKYSLRGEVLHYSFENESIFGEGIVDVDTDITVVRTGLTMHF